MKDTYFLNIDFGKKLTGIERSSLKRAFLFINYLKILPTFITSKLNLELEDNIEYYKKIGWMPKECKVINVYEDLRERDKAKEISSQSYLIKCNAEFDIIDVNENHQRYKNSKNGFSMYVVWRESMKKKLNYINFFYRGKIIRREKYDKQGRLFIIQFINEDSKIYKDSIVGISGSIVLSRFYNNTNSKLIRIEKYIGNNLESIFDSEQDLITYWLKIFKPKNKSLLIIDKNKIWSKAASALINNCKVISILHSIHVKEIDLDNMLNGRLNTNYLEVLEGLYRVNAIVTLTNEQKDDLVRRYQDKHIVEVIPHSLENRPKELIIETEYNFFNLIMMCRLAPEKQIEDAIYIMKELRKFRDNVRLFIYGEGSERSKIEKLIYELELQDSIFLPGFTNNIEKAYSSASLSMVTSKCEGFSLAVLESLSFGVPVFSYNIKYGPSSMIKDGVNGNLFKPKLFKDFAKKIHITLMNKELLQKMRHQAYLSAQNYSEKNIARKWEELIRVLYK